MLMQATRRLARTTSAGLVRPIAAAQFRAAHDLAVATQGRARERLVRLAGWLAELCGWTAQEAGDREAALRWTGLAAELAGSAGDLELFAYTRVRLALISLYGHDAQRTVRLAREVPDDGVGPWVRLLAAQREAQGHALAGDARQCFAALDQAHRLRDQVQAEADPDPVTGGRATDLVAVTHGWCLYDLGRFDEATRVLDDEVARIPSTALRAWARFTTRQALSHAANGDVDHACALVGSILDAVGQVDSASLRTDLAAFARTVRRWPRRAAVRGLDGRLALALRPRPA